MHRILFATLFAFGATFACAQSTDTLRMTTGFSGAHFFQGATPLTFKQTLNLMKDNPEAFKEMSQAKSNYNGAQVLGFIGGFMIGWPLGTALGGGDPQWGLAAAGAGVLLLSIPLNVGFSKHSKKAVQLYNNGGPSAHFKPTFKLGLHGMGAKLTMRL